MYKRDNLNDTCLLYYGNCTREWWRMNFFGVFRVFVVFYVGYWYAVIMLIHILYSPYIRDGYCAVDDYFGLTAGNVFCGFLLTRLLLLTKRSVDMSNQLFRVTAREYFDAGDLANNFEYSAESPAQLRSIRRLVPQVTWRFRPNPSQPPPPSPHVIGQYVGTYKIFPSTIWKHELSGHMRRGGGGWVGCWVGNFLRSFFFKLFPLF